MSESPANRLDFAIASLRGVHDLLCDRNEPLRHVDPNGLWFLLGLILRELDAAADVLGETYRRQDAG